MDAEEVRRFAREKVLASVRERSGKGAFDRGLWKELAELGITGMAIDEEHGGGGKGPVEFARHLAVLAAEGCDLGLALSVLDHVMICAYPLQRFGSRELKERFLPALCRGEAIGAAAISEPGSGGNPTRMSCRAERRNGEYEITGTKEPITNGPVADVFLVVASTDPGAGKDGLSAFMVERGDAVRVEELELGFLPTSPHGRVILEGARVPASNLLGEEGWGHERVSRSIFVWERAAVIPAILAFMERLHHLVVAELDAAGITPDARVLLAQRKVELTAYGVLARRLLELAFDAQGESRERMELLLFFGRALPAWAESLRRFVEEERLALHEAAAGMMRDLRLLEVGGSFLDWQFQKLLF